jgi:hypothetical protein
MNEYLEKFEALQEQNTFKGQQWFGERQRLVEEYSWAVPNEEAVLYLSEFDSLIEVGAGSGYWAKCIEDDGGSVRATDIDPPDETWADVEEAAAVDLDLTGEAVLMVWPPYDEMMAASVARGSPNHICYVGEPRGGCTGDGEFFNILEREYGLAAKVDIPSYTGVNDDLFHYIRKV